MTDLLFLSARTFPPICILSFLSREAHSTIYILAHLNAGGGGGLRKLYLIAVGGTFTESWHRYDWK